MIELHLVRHTVVASCWEGRCYGQSDAGLSRDGRIAARLLGQQLARLNPDRVFTSPLLRTRFLGQCLVRNLSDCALTIDPRLAECNFGAWEGRPWSEIYAETGDAMMGMIEEPHAFRPGGHGETIFEVRDRAMGWLSEVASHAERVVIAIGHGGPIAAIRGTMLGQSVREWPSLVPKPGEVVTIKIQREITR